MEGSSQHRSKRFFSKEATVRFLGISQAPTSHSEKIISALGGFIAIFCIMTVSHHFIPGIASLGIVASMGASAVLLFAVPHGPLSQPWPLMGSHLISAFVGVTCALFIHEPILAGSLAVGVSIGLMYYLKCIHPPGGATALTAVVAGDAVHQLGYGFMVTPVLLNIVIIFGVAMLFNSLFYWRRYPAYLQQTQKQVPVAHSDFDPLSHQDFIEALKEIDSFVDINEYDLNRILDLVYHSQKTHSLTPKDIHLGRVYSNGKIGSDWSMRKILDEGHDDYANTDYVIFKQIAGQEKKKTDCVTREEFARWAKYEMHQVEGRWQRVTSE
ncbi:HPP family protein [Hydrogenovibrio kuenenii]|uniref:HPP family protein n=1 Tax=Hydrogenovibrio kuenenii TaxID=63658 RepID=UPI00046787C5|nr:HPP family protein [Hydrogenovibrio kuenenii]